MKVLTFALVLAAGQPAFAGGYAVPVFDAALMPVTMPAPASTAVFAVNPWVVGIGIVGLILILSGDPDHHHGSHDSGETPPVSPTDPDPQPAAVPLPGAAVLLMSAAGALAAVCRRRARK